MELPKDSVGKLEHSGITVYFRIKATHTDKVVIAGMMREAAEILGKGGKASLGLGRGFARLFIIGWYNVVIDGQPVPYSYELLESCFPELFVDLCKEISSQVDALRL